MEPHFRIPSECEMTTKVGTSLCDLRDSRLSATDCLSFKKGKLHEISHYFWRLKRPDTEQCSRKSSSVGIWVSRGDIQTQAHTHLMIYANTICHFVFGVRSL